ncbi:hypothetical protein [Rickettsiales endosymbiont of Trichoplax sp. H2]|uniref:hypothetical protein n=1 Tax=Rickettsiales endosymbiont of Trichoplax sp. H2 TaxID=2021221 RepID=UPI0012B3246A|nr:hypothetical protein [Rickettsiales endosymbiont of Trichoplax sp. H2]MSO14515.1 hypothetical protein [Rickettsiales endosymbiont of Trichoplax sp. H2]
MPHLASGITGNGWGVDYIHSNIGKYHENVFNAEKEGLASLLFQDSDVHIGNEHYVIKDYKYYYIRLDVDHADFIYTPLSDIMDSHIYMRDTLKKYKFSYNALKILSELLEKREVFRKSILLSLNHISKLFSDEYIHRIYRGEEGFKAKYDTSNYYKPIDIKNNEELGKLVLSNFDNIFDNAEKSLDELIKDDKFSLLN